MDETLRAGWDYASKQMGANYAAQLGENYISTVDETVQKLVDDMNALGENALGVKQLKGFVAEYWHADTFNIEAALRDSSNRAFVDGSTDHASVDISTNYGKNYSLKYFRTAETSVEAQAKNVIQSYHEYLSKPRKGDPISFSEYLEKYGYSKDNNIKKLISDYRKSVENGDTSSLEQYIKVHAGEYDITSLLASVYNGQDRLIPTDQIKEAIQYLNREIAKESTKETSNRAAMLTNYKETLEKLVDRVSDGTGTESRTLTKEEAEAIAALVKEGKFKAEDFGLKLSDIVTNEYILHQALKAGYTSAVITLVMQLAPEIIKVIDYLIKNREINIEQIKKIGITTVTASAEGFLRGSISSALTIACMSGKLGEQFININPHVIGALTVIVLDIAKSSILVATGKLTAREMGSNITKELLISSAALAAGVLGQTIAPELPVLGYMLGSLIGSCVASLVVNVGEKCLISFCVDTGFTCFGLVEQNYELPEEVLKSMGINLAIIPHAEIKHTTVKQTTIKESSIKKKEYETIKLTMVRRGVIGINRIGYVLEQ
ncbi:MAG: hypothetical protein IJ050_08835 [Clostridia bacterium]|nr:hypothetical protein [Clostridia bacterium]